MSEVINSSNKTNKPKKMSFGEHLEDLRWHLVRGFGAILLIAIVAFFFKSFLFDTVILGPRNPNFITNHVLCTIAHLWNLNICINQEPFQMINIQMSGQFKAHILISIIAGIVIAFPYLIWELWRFVKPALHKREIKNSSGLLFAVSILFIIGVLFGYYLIVPLSINFLTTYSISSQVVNQINFQSYFSILTSIILASGVIFELPIIIYFLTKISLVNPSFLKAHRKHAVVLFVVLAAIITPPDVFSQVLVAVPLLLLYELSINISKRVFKKIRISTGIEDE